MNSDWRSSPAIIVNNVIPQVRRSSDFRKIVSDLEESASTFITDSPEDASAEDIISLTSEDVVGPAIVTLDHAAPLTAAPSGLQNFIDDLRGQACFDQLATGLANWTRDYLDTASIEVTTDTPTAQVLPPPEPPRSTGVEIASRRQLLHSFARQRVFAESGPGDSGNFLVVRSLRELGERFRTETPNATCIGMKGAGKTFTFNLLSQMKSWENFLENVRSRASSPNRSESFIVPVLPARNLQTSDSIVAQRMGSAIRIGSGAPIAFSRLNQLIDRATRELSAESDWGAFWLDVVAWSCGVGVEEPDAGARLLQLLVSSRSRLVALFDGLEESFQGFRANINQQAAIRGLTSSLAQRLLEAPSRPLGLINFVRSDLVSSAYPNNYRQFADRNRAFALTWLDRDILELAAWLASQSGAADTWDAGFQADPANAIEEKLIPLWGRKLGKADDLARGGRTREARSAEWVIAALSDLKGRLTARDLVGFIAYSAERSVTDENSIFYDRLLVPKAMTSAIAPVGRQKIEAMGEENPGLKPALEALRQAPQFAVPLSLAEFKSKIPNIDDDGLKMLEDNGIIFREGDSIEMPEIFRTGLGNVTRSTGGRKSIIGLMNKARQLRSSEIAP
ncbi:MAG TPA: hypothetical protein VH722_04755 [Alphaproteobacteria bacterium]|nr:hypothetical protein [Alphaproteobacteria bacterium]